MSPKLKVAIGGASGQTGLNIIDALLADGNFEPIALARPESAKKQVFVDLEKRGVAVKAVTYTDKPAVVAALQGVDVVISCLTIEQKDAERGLIDASKEAGVGRFVPSFFAIVSPRGVFGLRDAKEEQLDYIKRLYVPYTVIDIGWWYQLSVPLVPSGKLDDAVPIPAKSLGGKGETPIAFTDNRDIGKYVARVIADPRTLNKQVFVYNEVSTQERIWSEVEKLTGESIPRRYASPEEIEQTIKECKEKAAADAASGQMDYPNLLTLATTEYVFTWGIRGDNTPEHAQYLGYLIGKDLYPDLQGTSISKFLQDLVEGRCDAKVYAGRPEHPLHTVGTSAVKY